MKKTEKFKLYESEYFLRNVKTNLEASFKILITNEKSEIRTLSSKTTCPKFNEYHVRYHAVSAFRAIDLLILLRGEPVSEDQFFTSFDEEKKAELLRLLRDPIKRLIIKCEVFYSQNNSSELKHKSAYYVIPIFELRNRLDSWDNRTFFMEKEIEFAMWALNPLETEIHISEILTTIKFCSRPINEIAVELIAANSTFYFDEEFYNDLDRFKNWNTLETWMVDSPTGGYQ